MQKTIWKYMLSTLAVIGFAACENEINIAAEWEETAIVYAALNPTDQLNYIRIHKTYLDERESALTFVDEKDSLYSDTLEVFLDEYTTDRNGGDLQYIKRMYLKKVDGNLIALPKDSGLFYNDVNVLYQLDEPIQASAYTLKYLYNLTVKNPRTGYTCTASTESTGKPEVTSPFNGGFGTIVPRVTGAEEEQHTIFTRFSEGVNVRAYTIEMVMRIEEFKKDDPTQSTIKTLNWTMISSGKTKRLEGFGEATYLIPSVNFFATIFSQLEEDVTVSRRLVDYDMNFYGVSDEFNTYLSVSKPSIGIVQKKPEYTNVDNGLGIFASRHIERFQNKKFHETTLAELRLSEYTQNLGFVE